MATRHGVVVGQDPDLVLLGRVERDDGAATHFEQLGHGQHGPAEHDGKLDVDGLDLTHDDSGRTGGNGRLILHW